jgi:hypothetical protein
MTSDTGVKSKVIYIQLASPVNEFGRRRRCSEPQGRARSDGIIRARLLGGETAMTTEHTTEAVVHSRRTGANGIPDLPVEADAVKRPSEDIIGNDAETGADGAASTRPSVASLIALGAMAIGTIGACLGLMQSRRRHRRSFPLGAVPDPHALTPPHGDQLMRRR